MRMDALLPTLDHAQLRSFVAIAESGSATLAAERVGRTQSAVSMQMKKLEDTLGRKLFRKEGRGLALTDHGVYLLARARQLLTLNDEIIAGFRQPKVAGLVRMGVPDDYAPRYLPGILARFAAAFPGVDVAVTCEPSSSLRRKLDHGALDLALLTVGEQGDASEIVWQGPLVWVGPAEGAAHLRDPLPLACSHAPCPWRVAAERALKAAGRRFRVTYLSDSLTGQTAAVLAGLAVTICTPSVLPPGLRVLTEADGMPALPSFAIALAIGPSARQPVTDALARHIAEAFRAEATMLKRAA